MGGPKPISILDATEMMVNEAEKLKALMTSTKLKLKSHKSRKRREIDNGMFAMNNGMVDIDEFSKNEVAEIYGTSDSDADIDLSSPDQKDKRKRDRNFKRKLKNRYRTRAKETRDGRIVNFADCSDDGIDSDNSLDGFIVKSSSSSSQSGSSSDDSNVSSYEKECNKKFKAKQADRSNEYQRNMNKNSDDSSSSAGDGNGDTGSDYSNKVSSSDDSNDETILKKKKIKAKKRSYLNELMDGGEWQGAWKMNPWD